MYSNKPWPNCWSPLTMNSVAPYWTLYQLLSWNRWFLGGVLQAFVTYAARLWIEEFEKVKREIKQFVTWCVSNSWIIIIILVLQPGSSHDSPNDASLVHYFRCLRFAVVNSLSFEVFLNTIHPSYRGSSYLSCNIWICECYLSARIEFICSQ